MAATYVTAAELKTNLGIGTLYDATDAVETVCQTAEDLLNQYLWFDSYPVVGAGLQNNIATLVIAAPLSFVTGQTITVSNVGTIYNGSKVITSTWPFTNGSTTFPSLFNFPYTQNIFPLGYSLIQFAKTNANDNYHQVVPYGKALGVDTKSTGYAATPAIRQAALILASEIWQARQSSQNNGMALDGSISPWRMSNSLMAKVRGLISPYTSPRSMVG